MGSRQGTRARQQRQPRSRRPAIRDDRVDDRTEQLQPARNDDQALASRRYRDLAQRTTQTQGRLRLPVRRHPEQLSWVLQRVIHVPHARVVCRRTTEWRQRVLPAEFRRCRNDGSRNAPEHPRVLVFRAGRMAAAKRAHDQPGDALRSDEDRSTAGAQPRSATRRREYRHEPVGCRHQQLGPASRCRVEPGKLREGTSRVGAGVSSTAGRRRSCSARPTRTTASTSCR